MRGARRTRVRSNLMGFRSIHTTLIALLGSLVMCGCASEAPVDGLGCRALGWNADLVRWSSNGEWLAVGSMSPGRVVIMDWPDLEVLTEFDRAAGGGGWEIAGRSMAVDGDTAVSWMETNVLAPRVEDMAALWRASLDGSSAMFGRLPHPRFDGFFWVAGELMAREATLGFNEARLVRLAMSAEADGRLSVHALTEWRRDLGGWWVSRDGKHQVRSSPVEPGVATSLTIVIDEEEQALNVSDAGEVVPMISPDGLTLIYRDTATSTLMTAPLSDGDEAGLLSAREYFEGELSTGGVLAGVTGHGPGERNELCTERPTNLTPTPVP